MKLKYNAYEGEFDLVMGPGRGNAAIAFITDSGTANPDGNGDINVVGGTGIDTAGAGNTVTINFDITEVPTIADTYTGNSGTASPATNNLNILGAVVANSTHAVPLFVVGDGASTLTANIQYGAAVAATDGTKSGIVHFDNSQFSVDGSGFVQLIGGTMAIDTVSGDDNVPVFPDVGGNLNFNGHIVASGLHAGAPVYFFDDTPANTIGLDVQVAAAITGAPTDKFDAGFSSYNDTQFTVSTHGYVALVGGTDLPAIQTLTSSDPTAVGPDASGNLDLTTEAVANATNAGNPLYIDAGTNALNWEIQVAAAVTGAPGDKADAGICSFDDTVFAVSEHGYVTMVGGGPVIDSITVDAASGGGTNPVVPDGSGIITVTAGQIATGTIGANVIRTISEAANAYTIQIQQAATAAATDTTLNGVAHFSSADFGITTGFVELADTVVKSVPSDSGTATPSGHAFTIAGGTNIDTSASGATVTVNATGFAAYNWVVETGATRALSVMQGVFGNRGTAQTFTLPTTSAVGDCIEVVQMGAGAITIDYTTNQLIHFGTQDSTTTSGTLVTTNQWDAIKLVCNVANLEWVVVQSPVGNITVT